MASLQPDSSVFNSSWRNDKQSNDPLINFQAHVVPHIPRAWERAPHKPFAPQHRGRKVWKRYNLRSKELEQTTQTLKGQEGSGVGDEQFADTGRPIKRQCITNAPVYPGAQESQKPPKYITTLRARAPGTPRRKVAKRKSLKSDRRKSVIGQISEGTDIPTEIARALKESEEDTDEHPTSELDGGHSDPTDSGADGAEGSDEPTRGETLPSEGSESLGEPPQRTVAESDEPEFIGSPQDTVENTPTHIRQGDANPTTPKPSADAHAIADVSPNNNAVVSHGVEDTVMALSYNPDFESPRGQSTCRDTSAAKLQTYAVLEINSLQKQDGGNIDQSPPRDTFSATPVRMINSQASKLKFAPSVDETEDIEPQRSGSPRSGSPTSDGGSIDPSVVVETVVPLMGESPSSRHQSGASPIESQATEAVQPELEDSTAGPDTKAAAGDANQPNEALALPQSRTRSGTRFSDDTTLLKDFLNRARAHKAAKATPEPLDLSNPLHTAEDLPSPRRSPRRSPRKALLELDRNSPSPTKSRAMTLRPNTPPSQADKQANFNDADNNNNNNDPAARTEPTSCRRSARTRLPTPAASKTQSQTGGPSLIPLLRRGIEGAIEPIVLPKSEAQELAITTRANTRRNKGNAKRPALTLQTLPAEPSPPAKETTRQGAIAHERKTLAWDDHLVYFFQDPAPTKPPSSSTTTQPTATDPVPHLRRLKPPGLPLTGTPAPKPKPNPKPKPTQNLESALDDEALAARLAAQQPKKARLGSARGTVGAGAGAIPALGARRRGRAR